METGSSVLPLVAAQWSARITKTAEVAKEAVRTGRTIREIVLERGLMDAKQLDGILSDYKADSELNRIARTAVGHPEQISKDLFRVLAASHKLAIKYVTSDTIL